MILITGINGELGSALTKKISQLKSEKIIGFDLSKPNENIKHLLYKTYEGDIRDCTLIKKIFSENKIDTIYHLAAILSTEAEKKPYFSHSVNVDGFLNVINSINVKNVKFFFPSSIAVYHLDINSKNKKINENDFCNPNNIYGCNKLYCEKLGSYFQNSQNNEFSIDFRSIRFSGIISAHSLPQGGTSDYAPEMIHSAIQKKDYTCFVRKDSCIPFIVMSDAVNAIIKLMHENKSNLSTDVYHIQSFSPTAEQIYEKLISYFPNFKLNYKVDKNRQKMVDSWPSQLNQQKAINDWGWKPEFNFDNAFENYLIPKIKEYYNK